MSKRYRFAYFAAALASVSCGAGEFDGAETASENLAAKGLSATLSSNSDWGSGYCQNVNLTNVGTTTITQWQVQLELNGSVHSSGWSATFSTSGTRLIATPLDWNKTLAPGASTTIGFCATGRGRATLAAVSADGSGDGTGGATGSGGASSTGGSTSTGGTSGSTPYSGTPAAIPGTLQAENFDNGAEGVAYHESDTANSGGAYRTTGVDIEATTDTGGGYNVGWTKAGEWLNYTVDVATAGTFTLQARVASSGGGGDFHVEFGGTNATGTMTVPNTGGWQTYRSVSKTVTLSAGRQVMRLVADTNGSSGYVGNFNWISLSSGDTGSGGSGGTAGGGSGGTATGGTATVTVLLAGDNVNADGPLRTTVEENLNFSGGGHILVRPASITSAPNTKHPVAIWGPGGGTPPRDYMMLLNRMASQGFVVVGIRESSGGSELMSAAIDWLEARNEDPSSPMYDRLIVDRVGVFGHSMGGLSSEATALVDSRVATALMDNSGSFGHNQLVNMRVPVAIIYGEAGMERPNAEGDYNNPGNKGPCWLGMMAGGGHGSGPWDGAGANVAWMRWHIGGENSRKSAFLGYGGVYNGSGIWTTRFKNWDNWRNWNE